MKFLYLHQQEFLRQHPRAYVTFGCGKSTRLILVPYADFEPWLEDMWTTSNDDRMYWHVVIYREGNQYTLRRKKGTEAIDSLPVSGALSPFMKTGTPEPDPRYERYRLAYPSGTVVTAFYAGGVPLEEVRVTQPLAVVAPVEADDTW